MNLVFAIGVLGIIIIILLGVGELNYFGYFSELNRLKRKAKRLYKAIHSNDDAYDCGNALMAYVNPRRELKDEFIRVWKRIHELDPSSPPPPGGD